MQIHKPPPSRVTLGNVQPGGREQHRPAPHFSAGTFCSRTSANDAPRRKAWQRLPAITTNTPSRRGGPSPARPALRPAVCGLAAASRDWAAPRPSRQVRPPFLSPAPPAPRGSRPRLPRTPRSPRSVLLLPRSRGTRCRWHRPPKPRPPRRCARRRCHGNGGARPSRSPSCGNGHRRWWPPRTKLPPPPAPSPLPPVPRRLRARARSRGGPAPLPWRRASAPRHPPTRLRPPFSGPRGRGEEALFLPFARTISLNARKLKRSRTRGGGGQQPPAPRREAAVRQAAFPARRKACRCC